MTISFGRRRPLAAVEALKEKAVALAREVGLQIGGPDGVFPADRDLKELMARERARLERRTETVNKALAPLVGPQCEMLHFCLVPEGCWSGDTGRYLLEYLRLVPYSDWNIAFLPGNAFTAAITGLPLHQGAEVAAFTANAREFIQRCSLVSKAAAERVSRTGNLALVAEARDREAGAVHDLATDVRSWMEGRIRRTADPLQAACLDALSRAAQSD